MLVSEPTRRTDPGASPGTETGTYVTFGLSDQVFGVEVAHVREILDLQPVCRLPNASQDCVGVIDTRGESIPVIDLAGRLGIARGEPGPDVRIIVFEICVDTEQRPIGILADRVLNVTRIPAREIEPPPSAAVAAGRASAIHGIARLDGSLVVLLDIEAAFGSGAARMS